MQNIELLVVLILGTALMCILIAVQMKWYQVPRWKSIPVAVALVLTGVAGSYLWFFVENLYFDGRSLYGAIFFAPLVYWPLAKILKIPYGEILDFCPPAGSLTLALVKLHCMRDRCCEGMILYLDQDYHYVRFPSQIVECVCFLAIAVVLMVMSKNPKNRRMIFPWFLVIYGAARFVLSFLRETIEPYVLGLSAGSFWSLLALIVGAALLYLKKRNNPSRAE